MASFPLKTYQTQALDALTLFLRQAETMGLEPAWAHAMAREGISGVPYRAGELGDAPVVCLRIPTGGGKTLLASHAIVRIASTWAQRSHPVALWLVPSDAIRSQTLTALQTPGHAYAAALREAYGEAFVVCELDALASVPPQDYGAKAVIVVATIQSFRVANKAGRRVFAMSEAWEPHFRALAASSQFTPQLAAQRGLACVAESDLADADQTFLTRADLGRVKTSLANWLAWQQPIVLVDEAHNAKTPLSLAMLQGIRPSCVLDLTATPVPKKTNVLFSVSARQLEAEAMIKLPIMLAEHATGWQDAVHDALLRRKQLEAEAAGEPQYVRPIVLFQAEDKGGEANVEVLREHLITVHHIDAAEIARATGAWRELEGIDLMKPGPVRYIITVDALREGWDCPFAYVLCALQNLRSNQAVEQLLGRVLRMPYAQRRRSPALNKAYAHVVARSFSEAANALVDTLTQGMGFDRLSAASVLLPDEGDLFGCGLEGASLAAPRPLVLEIEVPGADAAALTQALADQPDAQVIATVGEPVRVRLGGDVSEPLRAAVLAALPAAVRERAAGQLDEHAVRAQAMRSPAERGVVFAPVPRLCVRWQGQLELIERETLAELIAFDLLAADPRPTLPAFNLVEQSEQFEIYLDGERVRARQGDATQLSLDGVPTNATESDLVRALEPGVRREGLTQTETLAYVQRVVAHLLHERGFTLTGLLRSRFQLARLIEQRIDTIAAKARSEGFQRLMFGGIADAQLAHDPLQAFRFEHGRYPVREAYSGAWAFKKHFYRDIATLKSTGEEFECAKALDATPEVLRWVRNLEQQPTFAFWLPTATDYFYPDFVAELVDGRVLVVEYKGDGFATNDDSREKRLVGERWAQQTGQCFTMAEKRLNGLDVMAQIRHAAR